ncbi:MAG: dTMP kinase [Propionibacteriaceae bacterium]|nr:dTMP kinase [Propionibacteriaceae bacterium]
MIKKNGMLIVFEGGDGAGKSTQSARLAAWLCDMGYQVRATFEPGDTELGAKVRQIVLHSKVEMCPKAEALLYLADKAQHVAEVIKPALEAGMIVISDRYVDSTIAYQGAGRALSDEEVSRIAWWAVSDLVPDLTVLMDVPVTQGLSRKDVLDRIESAGLEFHERVRDHFLALPSSQPGAYLVVNGRDPKDEVTAQIRECIQGIIDHSGHVLAREA